MAFNKGAIPTITLVNKATVSFTPDLSTLADILYRQIKWQFAPIWGLPVKNVKVAADFVPGTWAIEFLDDADAPGALGYHDLTPDGFPLSKVFVKTILNDNQSVSVTASHELMEMLLDPGINLAATYSDGSVYAYEVADAVEEQTYKIDNVEVSNFVFPSWFEEFHQPNSTQFDYLKLVSKPFQLLTGGYMPVFKNGQWTQIFGSEEKAGRFAKEDRRGHRSESRKIIN